MHNLKHVHVEPLHTVCQNTVQCTLTSIFPYRDGIYAVTVHSRVLNYAHNKELFFIINVNYPCEINGNLFVFNCTDICLKLCLSAALYIVV